MLKEVYDLGDFPGVVTTVLETDAPDADNRFTVMMLIGLVELISRNLHLIHEITPVGFHLLNITTRHPGEIIHDAIGTAVLVGTVTAMFQNLVGRIPAKDSFLVSVNGRLHDETLNKRAINPVVLHPLEMAYRCLTDMGTVHVGSGVVFVPEKRLELLVFIELAHVRPVFYTAPARPEVTRFSYRRLAPVMHPAQARPVAGGTVPALVAAHHFSYKR